MDRFIVTFTVLSLLTSKHLKSNMDRFIVVADWEHRTGMKNLKSNMDRFIVLISVADAMTVEI